MRLFIRLSYCGAPFSGWQSQTNAPSVQATLERALSIAFNEPIEVVGAGRTDAGVNARSYLAHFDTAGGGDFKKPEDLLRKINAILPLSIHVFELIEVAPDAHARFDATSRTYRYYVHTRKDPFATFSYLYTFPLDVAAMNRAAARLLGRRDFSCFEKSGADNATSICNLTRAEWRFLDETHLEFTITADRFLRNMVRAVVGTLLDVGRGKYPVEMVDEILASKDRCRAGQSVPGEALFLDEITYPYQLKSITND